MTLAEATRSASVNNMVVFGPEASVMKTGTAKITGRMRDLRQRVIVTVKKIVLATVTKTIRY